jgi:hypothetical protein
MKNIHIIPTDKPSRLHLGNSGLVLCDLEFGKNTINGQHIYITNSEEIRRGDYYLCKLSMKPLKCIGDEYFNGVDEKKIILTTDSELIKDGVQPIDDYFLEWFVKNPSCEFVEVNINSFGECHMEGDDCSCYDTAAQSLCKLYYPNYKIIIPKEEPQETLEDIQLEEVLGSSYCEYSVIENKLAALYRNQEQLLKAIKLLSNEKTRNS